MAPLEPSVDSERLRRIGPPEGMSSRAVAAVDVDLCHQRLDALMRHVDNCVGVRGRRMP